MIMTLVIFLSLFPVATKRFVANGYSKDGATIIWLLCTALALLVSYLVFGMY
ncbi:hypothetical protein [Paraburkholderia unamae]|uniref:Uncharacterized protein n=1 Tax=Paraburkholderia unamae TaxID=219649 RepID=A0ABX5KLY2_9BURK|nr:hypothetical protein [Paraburkholderia unamae]PVX80035.1 hypothetical protein C7402_112222 [Paraburkholderia unamae]